MPVTVTTNLATVAARHRARSRALRPRLEAAAQEVGRLLLTASRQVLRTRIYSVPIPRARTGRPKWTRYRQLYDREAAPVAGTTITLTNAAPHAGPRYRLGTPAGRPIRSPGIQAVQWHAEAQARTREARLKLWHAAQTAALRTEG
jgi:hypothetical protein